MIFKNKDRIQQTYSLDGKGIEAFSSWMELVLSRYKVERQNLLRIRLSFEEAVLRFRDHFGETGSYDAAVIYKNGKIILQISMKADPYNPLGMTEDESYDWSGSLLTSVGIHPQYNYSNGCNYLKIVLPVQNTDFVIRVFAAIVLGITFGVIGKFGGFLPVQSTYDLYMLFFDVWVRLLNLISGPVIFFMVISMVIGVGKISEVGGNSRFVFFRYSGLSVLAALLAVGLSNIVFHASILNDLSEISSISKIRQIIFSILPSELFTPFMESNTPQLILLAIVLGSLLNAIGEQVNGLNRIVRQINMVGLMLTEWVGNLVPFITLILIAFEIMNNHFIVLSGMWKCFVAAFLGALLYIFLIISYVSKKMHVPVGTLLGKVWEPFILTLKTGSINAALGQTEKSCIKSLGIEKKFATVSLGYGLILYLPVSIIGTVLFTFYAAMEFNVKGGIIWIITVVILSVILFAATPPIPGANLLAFTVIFAALKIPGVALTDAMVFDIVYGIFSSAANQLLLQMELVLQAYDLRVLDIERLRKKDEGI